MKKALYFLWASLFVLCVALVCALSFVTFPFVSSALEQVSPMTIETAIKLAFLFQVLLGVVCACLFVLHLRTKRKLEHLTGDHLFHLRCDRQDKVGLATHRHN